VRPPLPLRLQFLVAGLTVASLQIALAQGSLSAPKIINAGDAFTIQTTGSGKAALFIIGPGQVLKQDVQLGANASFAAGSLYNAGRYLVVLAGESSTESDSLDVLPASKPTELTFLAKPSRLPVGLHDGITGAVYVFDAYHNLITAPTPVSFELSAPSGAAQKRTVETHEGAAWTGMDSTAQQGSDKFVARAGDVSNTRIVAQVPGDPCSLRMSAKQSGQKLQIATEPVRDCNGNAVPDGTIVTFTENYRGGQSTVDVPLKRGIAEVAMPVHSGATISVASGVVMGNQIGGEK
jgi:hypothetical protein